jgi:hypothetical protein
MSHIGIDIQDEADMHESTPSKLFQPCFDIQVSPTKTPAQPNNTFAQNVSDNSGNGGGLDSLGGGRLPGPGRRRAPPLGTVS